MPQRKNVGKSIGISGRRLIFGAGFPRIEEDPPFVQESVVLNYDTRNIQPVIWKRKALISCVCVCVFLHMDMYNVYLLKMYVDDCRILTCILVFLCVTDSDCGPVCPIPPLGNSPSVRFAQGPKDHPKSINIWSDIRAEKHEKRHGTIFGENKHIVI